MAASSQVISSAANPLLKDIRRAVRQGTAASDGCVVAESFHLLEEALRSGRDCRMVLASASAESKVRAVIAASGRSIPLRVIDDRLFEKTSATETTQGVIALVHPPEWSMEDLFGGAPAALDAARGSLVVILDGVQDPGNAGAIVRAAEAFGAGGVMFLPETVSPFNPKTLRASAGSLFRLPFVAGAGRDLARKELHRREMQVLAASSREGKAPDRVDWTTPTALVIGSEAHGVSAELRQQARAVRIPTQGVESLNASTAAAVLLYEAARQRAAAAATAAQRTLA